MVTSWITESSLRSWWLLPPGRARSESTCFRRISARTPPPIPPTAPSNPVGSRAAPRGTSDKGAPFTAPFAGGSSGGMELAAPRAGCRPLQLPAGRRLSSLPLLVELEQRRFFGQDWGKTKESSLLLFLDGVPMVLVSLYGVQRIKPD